MAYIHLIVHVMHEFVPKSALIVLKGLGFKRYCYSSIVNIDRMVSLPQSIDSNPSVKQFNRFAFDTLRF
jgi:hypothetical protein